MQFGVIGGTGFYRLADEGGGGGRVEVETAYGTVLVDRVRFGDEGVAFIARHGTGHGIPPHRVNYRGNIAALKSLGVTNILASAAVGSLVRTMPPGALAILTQFIDFTRGRPSTFFDGDGGEVVHVDVTEPYCPHLREELRKAAEALGEEVHPEATYVCAEGPRFETPAEIRMCRQRGSDVVGMTSVPEAVLAREAGMCYASVAIVTNWAAGVSAEPIEHGQVGDFMGQQTPRVRALFESAIGAHREIDCSCRTWANKA